MKLDKDFLKTLAPIGIGIAIVFVLTVSSTIYAWANWGWFGPQTGETEAGSRIHEIPKEFGDWKASDDESLSETDITMLDLSKHLVRRYSNSSGEQVAVILMVGKTGRLAVHTPAVCFTRGDYKKENDGMRVTFRPPANSESMNDNHFWKMTFENQISGRDVRLFYYALGDGKEWYALENPRFQLSHYRYVYKLQCEAVAGLDAKSNNDLIERFLTEFLPVIQPYLSDCSKN